MEDLMYCDNCGYSMEWLDKCEWCGKTYCEYCGVQGLQCCHECEEYEEEN